MIDSHCHLTDERFDINEEIKDFKGAGIERVINIGTDMATSILAGHQAEMDESIYYSVAIYPENFYEFDEEVFEGLIKRSLGIRDDNLEGKIATLERFKILRDVHPVLDKNGKNKLLAIGEIGLDYHNGKDSRNEQIAVFDKQIKLAKKYNLPVIIHNRDASGDILDVLKNNAPIDAGGIIHCFSASLEWAKEVLKLGFLISFSGTLTFKNARNIKEVAENLDMDKILCETDAPYLTPEPYRGQMNHPKNVILTAKCLADIKGTSYEEVEKMTTENFDHLFKF